MPKYYTFLRSARNWQEFASAEKQIVDENLPLAEAQTQCRWYNNNLSDKDKELGTKMEFTEME